MAKTLLICDGDMGGDDLWAVTVLLANPEKIRIVGFATCYGNVDQPFATQNLLNHLHWLGCDEYEVAQGSDLPYDGMHAFGDGAYGENGVGGVKFPQSPQKALQRDIADWYAQKLEQHGDLSVFCTGPATNMAKFITKYPDKVSKIREFIFMGGAINPPGKDRKPYFMDNGEQRIGNITPHAEFNAYQDPHALNIILKSGIKTTFVPADATQHMVYTEERKTRIQKIDQTYAPAFHRMMVSVEPLDRSYFEVEGGFIHDPTAAAYLLAPHLFTGQELSTLHFEESPPRPLQTTRRGEALLNGDGKATWLNGVTDDAAVFEIIENALRTMAGRASENRAHLAV